MDYIPPCKRCGRHVIPIQMFKRDPKTNKPWLILTCTECGYESDLEEIDFDDFNHNKKYYK